MKDNNEPELLIDKINKLLNITNKELMEIIKKSEDNNDYNNKNHYQNC